MTERPFAPMPVAALADVLDRRGLRNQVMSSRMRPVAAYAPILGPAFTIQAVPQPRLSARPYEKELEATDAVTPGSVVVIATNGTLEAGIWGELLTTRAQGRGSVGAVIDGGTRDLDGVDRLEYPTFATAVHAADSYGRVEVTSWDEPVVCAGVAVHPGDLVAADRDGVVVIPADVADVVLGEAGDKLEKERSAQAMLRDGASVAETYQRHGVL